MLLNEINYLIICVHFFPYTIKPEVLLPSTEVLCDSLE